MIKLGTLVKDKATKLEGMCVHMQIQSDQARWYNFQPRGLSPDTSEPLKRFWATADRLVGGVEVADPELPLALLGTEVEDIASGFKGTATAITLHINGCVHVSIQPPGLAKKSGNPIASHDFDLRLCKGKHVPKLSEVEREKSEKRNPSPSAMDACGPRDL